jgi:hypothetical protein
MSSTEPGSLASVFRSGKKIWTILPDDEPLAQFHRKFWGTSMFEEETAWRNAQLQTSHGGHGEASPGGNQRMDEDEENASDAGEAEDDDFIPGCYFLKLGINDLPYGILIRALYIRIYDACRDYFDEPLGPDNQTPSMVLSGQPGIGESPCVASSMSSLLTSDLLTKARVFGSSMLLVAASPKRDHFFGIIKAVFIFL